MSFRRGPHVLELSQPKAPLLGPAPPGHLEDRLAAIDREIHALLVDNQRLAAVHVALSQELVKSQHELRVEAGKASQARAENEAELRDVVERSVLAEAAARQVEGVRMEISRVSEDVRRLSMVRDEMVERLVGMKGELRKLKDENGRMDMVAKEIDSMQRELQKGRAAIEFEKKAHADNQEQSKQMENKMHSMAREIEKLRIEFANVENKLGPTSATNPAYAGAYSNPYDVYNQAQVQNVAAAGVQPSTGYNTQQIHPQR